MKIHGDIISPFTRMCLVTAHEVGLADKVSLVPAHVRPMEVNNELSTLSPIGKIPVLETDHGHAIYDSRVIMEYLAHHAGVSWFIPDDGVKRFRVLTLLALAQGLGDAAVGLRYEQAMRPQDKQWPEYRSRLEKRVMAGIDAIEQHWHDSLAGVMAASVAVACVLRYIDHRHDGLKWRNGRPLTTTFEASFAARDSMKAWPLA